MSALTEAERQAHGRSANDFPGAQLVYSLTDVEAILTARLAAPFRCETHLCGACGGCKAAKVTDLLTTAQRRLAAVEALTDEMDRAVLRSGLNTSTAVVAYYEARLRAALAPAAEGDAGVGS